MELAGLEVLVVGLARSGLAAANFLVRRQARVSVTDLRPASELASSIERLEGEVHLALGGHRRCDFLETELIVLSPGVPSNLPLLEEARQAGIPVVAEVELAYPFLRGPLLGVTGSNGKTTTTTLIGELCSSSGRACAVAGNIGSPLIEWAGVEGERLHVVELSSFQLENIHELRCQIALVLNVTPDHQDRYRDFESYARAKERIFLNQSGEDTTILNADDARTLEMAGRCPRPLLFSCGPLEEGVCVADGQVEIRRAGERLPVLPVAEIPLLGRHNLENVLAATAAGFLAGLEPAEMARAIRRFRGVEHRLEWVRNWQGVDYYNDSKATNLASARRALEAFSRPLILIMGGRDKGADFRELRPSVTSRVRQLLVVGEAARKISQALSDLVPTHRAADLEEAVTLACKNARAGDAVLLSPACASFDMFENFEQRGRVFKEAVGRLGRPEADRSSG